MLSVPLTKEITSCTRKSSHGEYLPLDERILSVVMQPTNFCNVSCRYCYLGNKEKKNDMSISVARCVARGLYSLPHPVNLIWHSGEPLSIGIDKLSALFSEFMHLVESGKVHHAIQTNATLINSLWCDFFKKNEVAVSVSIDGPIWANSERVYRNNTSIFSNCMRGIETLKQNSIPFNVICVVTEKTIDYPEKLFEFFTTLGCKSIGFNIVEQDGVALVQQPEGVKVRRFWKKLFDCWKEMPVIDIREFRKVFNWLNLMSSNNTSSFDEISVDLVPTVSLSGDLRVLSPELAEIASKKYSDFIIGSVVDRDFSHLIQAAKQQLYYREFIQGKRLCYEECDYFSYCRGGSASNKYAENGDFSSTETSCCINSKKYLVDAVLEALMEENHE